MTNLEPLNVHGHANTWEEELQEVCAERDALRAAVKWNEEQRGIQAKEIERLKALKEDEVMSLAGGLVIDAAQQLLAAQAENERLRQQHENDVHTIKTGSRANAGLEIEIERLRAELAQERNERDATADMLREARAEIERLKAEEAAP